MSVLKLMRVQHFEPETMGGREMLEIENARGKSKSERRKKLKRAAAAILTGGASEMARFAKNKISKMSPQRRKQIAAAILTGGASEMARLGIKKVGSMSPNQRKRLATAIISGGASEAARAVTEETESMELNLENESAELVSYLEESLESENAKGKKSKGSKSKSVKKTERKAKFKKFAKKGLEYAKYSALTPLFLPVLPFKPAMVIMLKKRGIKTNIAEPLAMVAEKFVKNIGKNYTGKKNFEESCCLECFDIENFTGEETMDQPSESFAPAVVAGAKAAIKIIVKIFGMIKAKKESGQKLNEDEGAALATAEKTAEASEGRSTEEVSRTMKEPTTQAELKAAVDASDKTGTKSPEEKDAEASRPSQAKGAFSMKGLLPIALIIALILFLNR